MSKEVDSFFLLCVTCKFASHMAIIHMDGVWSMHLNGQLRESNLMLAQTMDGFCEVLKIKDDVELYDTLPGDATCLDSFWTSQPPRFTAPVEDPHERADDAGYQIQLGQSLWLLKSILSKLMGVFVSSYRFFMRC